MSTDLSDLMAEDSQSPLNLPSNEGLSGVQKLANDILAAQLRVENLEADLKAAKQTLLKLTDEDLPSQMTEIGLTNFTLADGSKVDIKQTLSTRIKKDNEDESLPQEMTAKDLLSKKVFWIISYKESLVNPSQKDFWCISYSGSLVQPRQKRFWIISYRGSLGILSRNPTFGGFPIGVP